MKTTQFMFCTCSPFLFSLETPCMVSISLPADSESAPLTRPGRSHLPHPSKGPGLNISKNFCTHFRAAYMQTNIFLVCSKKASFQFMAIYSFFLPMLPHYRIKFSLCGMVHFWKKKKSAGYYWLPQFLAIFSSFCVPFWKLKLEIMNKAA